MTQWLASWYDSSCHPSSYHRAMFIVAAPQWFDARKIAWLTLSQAGLAVPSDLVVTPIPVWLVADMQRRRDERPEVQ